MKPTISKQLFSFVRTEDNKFDFYWDGGKLQSSTIQFYDLDNNNLVYEHTYESAEMYHTLPSLANTYDLPGGKSYVMKLYVTLEPDGSQPPIISEKSDSVLVYVYGNRPTFKFYGFEDKEIFTNGTLSFEIIFNSNYSSTEKLDNFKFYLYDYTNKNIPIDVSDTYYNSNDKYNLYGLNNGKYFIRSLGITQNKLNIDTGYYEFEVDTNQSHSVNAFEVNNIKDKGYIDVSTNIISQGYDSYNVKWDKKWVDLRYGWVDYNEGFMVAELDDGEHKYVGSFQSKFTLRNPGNYKKIIVLQNSSGDEISIRYMLNNLEDKATKAYFLLEQNDHHIVNNIATDFFDILKKDQEVILVINRIHNIYTLIAKIGGVEY